MQSEAPNYLPIYDRILVEPDPPKMSTESGILLAKAPRVPTRWGTVIAVGPGNYDKRGRRIDHGIRVGHRALFQEMAGADIGGPRNKDKLFVLRAEEVLAVDS